MTLLNAGEPAPWFHAAALDGNPRYAFDSCAGRAVVMLFHGSAAWPATEAALTLLAEHRALFDDERACFYGVSIDREDAAGGLIRQQLPGIRWFLDFDRAVSRAYGAFDDAARPGRYAPHWLLLDRTLRVVRRAPIASGRDIFRDLARLIEQDDAPPGAPVLIVPRVLDQRTCVALIDLYDRSGGKDSGFMRDEDGVTVEKIDHRHKRRSDCHITDSPLIAQLKQRLTNTLRPMIARAFQFDATRVERWMVACYDGDDGGGYFRAHRDNTTRGTAHRKCAVTINLNAEDYDGGDLRFPEFGPHTYRAPTGGAVVFSCALLHEALPVTRGRRYAFLPFLYDDAGARQREANLAHVAPVLQGYRSGLPLAARGRIA